MRSRMLQLAAWVVCALVLVPIAADAQRYRDRDDDDDRRGGRGGWWSKPGNTGSWERLGAQRVGFNVDRDVIRVGRQEGRFEAIKLRISGNDVQMISARLVFANGQTVDLGLRGVYRAGSETGTIDISDDRARSIQEVQLVYRSNPRFSGEAVVELWGLHADERHAAPRREARIESIAPPRGGRGPAWEMLGERRVDLKVDRDVVPVGRWEGAFTKIRLKVLEHDIELRDVTIVYANGEVDHWPVRRRVRDEEEGPVFDLTGHRRSVERVMLTYRATNPFGRTTVQVWGGR